MRRGDVVEAVHRVHVATTRRRALRRRPRLLPALLGEADPGDPVRRGLRRPRRRRDRDRLRVAPCRARAARRGAQGARARRRDGGRPRERPAGGPARREARPQLLRQARRDARRVPRARLAASPATALPTHPLQQRIAELIGGGEIGDRRLRRADVRAAALRRRPRCSRARRRGSATRCARGPSWSAARAAPTTPT